ncbi:hypothetical protein FQN57_003059 [Myotisia sp. PD_48]|nr:hypothetical protein FQN57_003059 [Myotisia sp. PD_48]
MKWPYVRVIDSVKSNIRSGFSRSHSMLTPKNELFEYTRGRFLLGNEKEQRAKRRVHFDLQQLASTAANSIGAKECINIAKCPDGLYNKAFILTMDTGKQVIAKIPNPTVGIPFYTTASEVATMDFARSVLETPVPKVYAWNATINSNPVGAEFIIMEKIPGVLFSTVWRDLEPKQKLTVFAQVARYMRRWSDVRFNKIGGLYYAKDLDVSLSSNGSLYMDGENPVINPRFTIGPSTNREWSDEGRQHLQCDRGPWSSVMAYRNAIGNRETAAVQTLHHVPKQLVMLFGPQPFYQPAIERKFEALRLYSNILDLLIPTKDPTLMTSHLWHNDLHHENIFIDPETLQIQGIIDWQSIQIAPLTDHCLEPSFLDYYGPEIGDNLERPTMPNEIKHLKGEERTVALDQYVDRAVMIAWRRLVRDKSPSQYRAIKFQDTAAGHILHVIRRIFEADELYFFALLLDLRDERAMDGNPQSQFPLEFSKLDEVAFDADVTRAELGVAAIRTIQQRLGNLWPEKGIADNDHYDKIKLMLQKMKAELIAQHAVHPGWDNRIFDRFWPFGD